MDINILLAIITCTGFWGFVTSLVTIIYNRKSGIQKDLADLKKAIETEKEERLKKDAQDARNRILQFGDECRRGVKHSREFFIQINDDVSDYEAYCTAHPEFKNNRTKDSESVIAAAYSSCMAKNDFL